MQKIPFLLSISGTTLNLAPDTSPLITATLSNPTNRLISSYTIYIEVFKGNRKVRHIYTSTDKWIIQENEEITQNDEKHKIWNLYGFYNFDRILFYVESVEYDYIDNIECIPYFIDQNVKQDCQETIICLKNVIECQSPL